MTGPPKSRSCWNHSWAEPAHRALTRRQEPLNRQDAEDDQARSGPGSELSGGDQFRTTDRGLSAGAQTKRRKIAKWIKFATEYDPVISVVPLSLGTLLEDKERISGKTTNRLWKKRRQRHRLCGGGQAAGLNCELARVPPGSCGQAGPASTKLTFGKGPRVAPRCTRGNRRSAFVNQPVAKEFGQRCSHAIASCSDRPLD